MNIIPSVDSQASKKLSAFASETSRINQMLRELSEAFGELRSRIDPIVGPPNPVVGPPNPDAKAVQDNPSPPVQSDFDAFVSETVDDINNLRKRVVDVIERLSI